MTDPLREYVESISHTTIGYALLAVLKLCDETDEDNRDTDQDWKHSEGWNLCVESMRQRIADALGVRDE
jgi:hypothetical protein